jgi:alcohol dehydrogenase class IV
MSCTFCLSTIKLISGNLRQAWANGNNVEAREGTMLGALQARIAFSNASVALVHGISGASDPILMWLMELQMLLSKAW